MYTMYTLEPAFSLEVLGYSRNMVVQHGTLESLDMKVKNKSITVFSDEDVRPFPPRMFEKSLSDVTTVRFLFWDSAG